MKKRQWYYSIMCFWATPPLGFRFRKQFYVSCIVLSDLQYEVHIMGYGHAGGYDITQHGCLIAIILEFSKKQNFPKKTLELDMLWRMTNAYDWKCP